MNTKSILTVLLSGTILLSIIIASRYTEIDDQEDNMTEGMQIYPVLIPASLDFCGESVPLDRFEIKERLDRELLVNAFWQSNATLIIKRSKRYFEIIEPILKLNGVPDDFKYLAVAESGLQNAVSSAGAKGIWQFMASSAKEYGLEVTNDVDERYHLQKATEAACEYLLKGHAQFGSWTMAAAAYNRGSNGIRRDLSKQLISDYYDMHLNSETARYVFRILAFKTIIENPKLYGYHIENKDYYGNIPTTSITVDTTIENISEYASQLGTNYHVLKSLNPWIIGNELPVDSKSYTIKAPLVN
jgi:hypothetical protein